MFPKPILKLIKKMQKNEITEVLVYENLAKKVKNQDDKKVLLQIANEEKIHYEILKNILKIKAKPYFLKLIWYNFLIKVFGYTFTLKIMQKKEHKEEKIYEKLKAYVPQIEGLIKDEKKQEIELFSLLKEDRLNYLGSIVLGLNDALVELSGAIAGLTFALSNTKLISLSALITGIAASLSMASSEYLSAKTEGNENAKKAAIYTGITYIITVFIMTLPYLIIAHNKYLSLVIMLVFVVIIIFIFNYYISLIKQEPFKKRFFQMVTISLSVALVSFFIGYIIKLLLGVEV